MCWVYNATHNFTPYWVWRIYSTFALTRAQFTITSPANARRNCARRLHNPHCVTNVHTHSFATNRTISLVTHSLLTTHWTRRPIQFNWLHRQCSSLINPQPENSKRLTSLLPNCRVYRCCWAMLPSVVYCCVATSVLRLGSVQLTSALLSTAWRNTAGGEGGVYRAQIRHNIDPSDVLLNKLRPHIHTGYVWLFHLHPTNTSALNIQ
jgi:hypothetical protein